MVTACREVAEETGVDAAAGRQLDVEQYNTALGPEAVEYWAMRGRIPPFRPTAEVDRLAWLPLADARPRLDYRRDGYAIDALEAVADSSLAASVVLLVRNARAVPARRLAGTAGGRPLAVRGREQAEALRRALSAFGPSRLLSAPEARFADTVRPLGADLGLPVEPELALGEDEYAAHPRRGQTRILELADAGATTVVCVPGAVIQHLLAPSLTPPN